MSPSRLTLNGVDVPGIGDKMIGMHVLRAGLLLTAHAQSQMPYDRRMQTSASTTNGPPGGSIYASGQLIQPCGVQAATHHDEQTGILRVPDLTGGGCDFGGMRGMCGVHTPEYSESLPQGGMSPLPDGGRAHAHPSHGAGESMLAKDGAHAPSRAHSSHMGDPNGSADSLRERAQALSLTGHSMVTNGALGAVRIEDEAHASSGQSMPARPLIDRRMRTGL
jgi:hypothetical protein